MILYFTGTGNSAYVADYLGDRIGDEVVNLFDRIKNNDYSTIESSKPYVVCCPTYCWQIPHILRDWLLKAQLAGNDEIYFVMTCGGETGNAEKFLKKLCQTINKKYMGHAPVVMPENYIAMFDAPDDERAKGIIDSAHSVIDSIADRIIARTELRPVSVGFIDRLYSGLVNDLFYPLFVKDKKFYTTDSCVGCGKCESLCVNGNITIIDGKPTWNGNCTHCMACISYCPTSAIEYGKNSLGQNRYTAPKFEAKD